MARHVSNGVRIGHDDLILILILIPLSFSHHSTFCVTVCVCVCMCPRIRPGGHTVCLNLDAFCHVFFYALSDGPDTRSGHGICLDNRFWCMGFMRSYTPTMEWNGFLRFWCWYYYDCAFGFCYYYYYYGLWVLGEEKRGAMRDTTKCSRIGVM